MHTKKRLLSAVTAAGICLTALTSVLPAQTALAAVSYPVQEFRLGMADTDNNVTADGVSLAPAKMQGTAAEKWSVNYVSEGVFEIVSSASGQILTANGTGVSLAKDADGANQRWKIESVQKDFDGYALYYKITSNADSSKALTYTDGSGFSLKAYSGETYQKYKLNLDGLEGFAANCMTAAGEKAGTIGGLLGETVFVSTDTDLIKALDSAEPKTVVVTADIDMQKHSHTRLRDNKTLVGCYGSHTLYDPYFRTNNEYGNDEPSDNIIIRNLKMVAKNCPNRILVNVWSSRQIWIDHIYFESQLSYDRTGNGQDEVGKFIWINTPYESYMDAKDRLRSPDYVTISYCHLKNRYWTVAYGTQNDEITRDRTTLLYNWWDQNVRRCPQLGNGSAHVYNNYYSAYGKGSNGSATTGIIGGDGSEMLSQNNMFNGYTAGQALTMGGDANKNPARDDNSYISEALNGTPSKINFQSKNTSKWYPEKTNYGYTLLDAYNTKNTDTKAFCTKYAGDQTSAANMKYITDSDFAGWGTVYTSPFLKSVELKTKAGAVFDTAVNYTIKNVGSGLYLMPAETPASGVNVQQGTSANRDDFTWTLSDAGDGYYYIAVTSAPTLVIDLPYGSADNGTSIGLWGNDESDARKFKFLDNGDGSCTIVTKCSADASAFGVISDSTEAGADVIQWACNGQDSQKWIVSPRPTPLTGKLIANVELLDPQYYASYAIDSAIAAGDAVYGDRDTDKCAVSALPDALAGAELLLTACDAKNLTQDLAELTAAQDITVYAAFDSRVTAKPAWLSGWAQSDLTIGTSNDVTFVLYVKALKSGESLTLGENGQASGCMNYFVLALPAQTAPETTTAPAETTTVPTETTTVPQVTELLKGDVDCSGEVNIADAVLLARFLAEDTEITVSAQGKENAELSGDSVLDTADSTKLLEFLAGLTNAL